MMRSKTYIKENIREMSVARFSEYIKTTLVPKLTDEERAAVGLDGARVHGLSTRVVWTLMTHPKMGCKYRKYRQSYYVDGHEKPEVQAYRKRYIEKMREYERQMFRYIQLEASVVEKLRVDRPELPPGFPYQDGEKNMVEFNVLDTDEFDGWRTDPGSCGTWALDGQRQLLQTQKYGVVDCTSGWTRTGAGDGSVLWMGGNLSVRRDREKDPIVHLGQDESCFRAYSQPARVWTVDDKQPLRQKSEGQSIMVSGVVGGPFTMGCPVPKWVLEKVNAARAPGTQKYRSTDAAVEVAKNTKKAKKAEAAAEGAPAPRGAAPDPCVKPVLHTHVLYTDAGNVEYCQSPGFVTMTIGKAKEGYWTGDHMLLQCEDLIDVLGTYLPHVKFLLEVDHSSGHDQYKKDALHVGNMNVEFGYKETTKEENRPKNIRDSTITEGMLGRFRAKKGRRDYKLKVGEVQHFNFGTGRDAYPPHSNPKAPRSSWEGKPKGMRQILFERGLLHPALTHTRKGKINAETGVVEKHS